MKIKNITTIENLELETINTVNNETLNKSQKMKLLFSYGISIKQIASLLNVRYNFVYNVIQNQVITEGLEIQESEVSSKKELVRELFNAGHSTKSIAVTLKTNYNYIYKLVREIKDESVPVVNDQNSKQA